MSECGGPQVDRAKVHHREPVAQRLQTPCNRATGQNSVLAICGSWSCCGRVQFGQFIRLRIIRYVAVEFEFVQHLAPSAMQPSFHRADRATDHHGNLVVGLTLFVEQDEHFPIIIPQRIDRGLQCGRQFLRRRVCGAAGDILQELSWLRNSPPFADASSAAVDRDAENPRTQGPRRIPLVQTSEDAQKHFLRHIFRILTVTEQTQDGTQQTAQSIHKLSVLAQELKNSVARFRIAN